MTLKELAKCAKHFPYLFFLSTTLSESEPESDPLLESASESLELELDDPELLSDAMWVGFVRSMFSATSARVGLYIWNIKQHNKTLYFALFLKLFSDLRDLW